jgi:hypothetical protein
LIPSLSLRIAASSTISFRGNNAISRLEREIELFREYRTRITIDVVTGKFDVREVAEQLPDEVSSGGVLYGLLGEAVFQLEGRDRQTVDEQAKVQRRRVSSML